MKVSVEMIEKLDTELDIVYHKKIEMLNNIDYDFISINPSSLSEVVDDEDKITVIKTTGRFKSIIEDLRKIAILNEISSYIFLEKINNRIKYWVISDKTLDEMLEADATNMINNWLNQPIKTIEKYHEINVNNINKVVRILMEGE
jgi:hypothetical protein